MNVLIIAYQFPPLNTGGSHRPFKFAKYLSQFGIHPIILTPELAAHEGATFDESQLEKLKQPLEIIRTPVKKRAAWKEKLATSYYFNIEDTSAKKWESYLTVAIEQLVKEREIAAMYVTAPPFSMANMGRRLASRFNLPFILDMRDAWSNWVTTPYVSKWHYKATLQRERKALSAADAILVTSDQTIADFQRLHPRIPKNNFHLITNAYDEELKDYPTEIQLPKATFEQPLRIGYVGSFYYTPYQRALMFKPWWKKKPYQYFQYTPRKEDWLYRSPYFFFQALAGLKKQLPNLEKLLNVEFVGTIPDWLPPMIQKHQLGDLVKLKGRKSHKEALIFQQEVDALLITSSKVIGGEDYSIAGKTFEYVCQKKPILAFVAQGAQQRILEKTGLSLFCPPDKPEVAQQSLKYLLEGKVQLQPDFQFIQQLHVSYTTEQLAKLLKKLKHD